VASLTHKKLASSSTHNRGAFRELSKPARSNYE
jgi:hypothetical protein